MDTFQYLIDVQKHTFQARKEIEQILHGLIANKGGGKPHDSLRYDQEKIYQSLLQISEALSNSYFQVNKDINDTNRISFAGTAHEIRELIASLLRTLATDEQVKLQSWYQQEPNTKGPTHKQRVHYILRIKHRGSKEEEVLGLVTELEGMIESLVRATYSRASDAAHTFKSRQEVRKLLRYYEAFVFDLLNIE